MKQYKCINGFVLKMIAILTMLTDHVGAVLFPYQMSFRIIGRIAFPIFVFLMVEGFYHTKNIRKYELRMLLFVFLSEIPFDLAFHRTAFYFYSQNVFFTLFLGLLMLDLMSMMKKRGFFQSILGDILLIGFMVLAYVLMTDYDAGGILLIYVFYRARERNLVKIIGLALISYFVIGPAMECFSLLAFIPILLYNGQRGYGISGRNGGGNTALAATTMKYAFYIFYPVHLLILHLIDMTRVY